MTLSLDIKKWEEKALLAINKSFCNKVEELFVEPVKESPDPPGVGGFAKGLLKNSWFVQVNGTDDTVGTVPNAIGADSLSRIKAVLTIYPFYGKDAYITLTNSVEHAYRAEVLGWPQGEGTHGFTWSGRVGPYSMIRTAVTNFKGKYA